MEKDRKRRKETRQRRQGATDPSPRETHFEGSQTLSTSSRLTTPNRDIQPTFDSPGIVPDTRPSEDGSQRILSQPSPTTSTRNHVSSRDCNEGVNTGTTLVASGSAASGSGTLWKGKKPERYWTCEQEGEREDPESPTRMRNGNDARPMDVDEY